MGPVRRPSFLAKVSPEGEARPASFAHAPGHRATPLAPGRRAEPEAAPGAAALAAVRAEVMERVAHAVEVLRLLSDRLAEQARSDALEIGFQVARRVIEAELQTSPETLFALVRSALRRAGDARKIMIRLHPEDARVVGATVASGDLAVSVARVEVQPDPTLERGDCLVETELGEVDGRLATRLDELKRAALSAVEEGAA
jgi:flagellar assembly protein FliH